MNRATKMAGPILDMPGAERNGEETSPVMPESGEAYINRELSWLQFAQRVMALAEDRTVPLLERVKFAGIMGMLYDEFAMKRIGGLRRRIERKNTRLSPDGRTSREELQLCREELENQTRMLCRVVEKEIRPALAEAGIALKNYDQLNADERAWLETYFRNSVQPILTPLAVDVGHPFPFISNLALSLAVWLSAPGNPVPRAQPHLPLRERGASGILPRFGGLDAPELRQPHGNRGAGHRSAHSS
jgi:polyphosphate kinase